MALVWSDTRFATGVEPIDTQHREMFRRVNELLDAVQQQQPRARVEELLGALGQDAAAHFCCEEDIMERRHCSTCQANKLAHRGFLTDFAELGEMFVRDGVSARFARQIEETVCQWLESHLLAVDLSLRGSVEPDLSDPSPDL